MGNGGGTGETVRYSIVLHLSREAHVQQRVISPSKFLAHKEINKNKNK